MQGAERKRKRKYAKKRRTARLQKQSGGNPFGSGVNNGSAGCGKQTGEQKAGHDNTIRKFIVPGGGLAGYELGNSGLQAGGRQGKGEGGNGGDQLINTHSLCTKKMRKKNSVEEPDASGKKACYGQNKGPDEKRIFSFQKLPGGAGGSGLHIEHLPEWV